MKRHYEWLRILTFVFGIMMMLHFSSCKMGLTPESPKATDISAVNISVEELETKDGLLVTMTTETEGADIYYTTDGSIPTANSSTFTKPFIISEDTLFAAIAVKSEKESKQISYARVIIQEDAESLFNDRIETQYITFITEDNKDNTMSVTMVSSSEDSEIFYTTDGSNPTQNSSKYTIPIIVDNDNTVVAMSVRNGVETNPVSYSKIRVLEKNITEYRDKLYVAAVTFSTIQNENGTSYLKMTTTTKDALIYYTVDGSIPTKNSLVYKEPIAIDSDLTITAIAVKDGFENSPASYAEISVLEKTVTQYIDKVVEKEVEKIVTEYVDRIVEKEVIKTETEYVDKNYVAAVSFTTLDRGNGNVDVMMTTTTNDASIYYTTDGTIPTKNSSLYTDKVSINANTSFVAIALKEGMENSPLSYARVSVVEKTITQFVDKSYTKAVTFSSTNNSNGTVTVSLSSATIGAKIYYTTDGTIPSATSATSTLYSAPLPFTENGTISAIAVSNNMEVSPVSYANVLIVKNTVTQYTEQSYAAPVTFSTTDNGNGTITVSMGTTTNGAEIYYTTDGTIPTSSSTRYVAPFIVSETSQINAIAVKDGMQSSSVSFVKVLIVQNTITEYVNKVYVAPVTFTTMDNGNGTISVRMSTTTSGASIYYTTDGTIPAVNSTLYTEEIAVSENKDISAIAIKTGMENSPVSYAKVSIVNHTVTQFVDKNYTAPVSFVLTDEGNGLVTLSMTSTTAGSNIYYTTDGSTPNAQSVLYSAPIQFTQSAQVSAVAVKSGMELSPVSFANVLITEKTITQYVNKAYAEPVIFSTTTNADGSVTVTMSSQTNGSSIYYSKDDSLPNSQSTKYTGPLTITQKTTYKAIAIKDGIESSPVSIANIYATLLDLTAPAAITNLEAVAKDSTVLLTWTDASDADVYGYEVSYDGAAAINRSALPALNTNTMMVAPGAGGCYVSGLRNGVQYSFTVKTVDTSGNKSEGVSITATPAVSAAAPLAITFTYDIPHKTGNTQTLTVTALITTPGDVTKVVYKKDGSLIAKTLLSDSDAIEAVVDPSDNKKWTFNISATDTSKNGETYTVAVLDSAGRRETEQVTISGFEFVPPALVTDIGGVYSRANNAITLNWTEPVDIDFDHVKITYNYNGGSESEPVLVSKGTTCAVITGVPLSKAKNCTYSIVSVDKIGNESSAATYFDHTPPAVVTGFSSVYSPVDNAITLTWTEPSDTDFNNVKITYTCDGVVSDPVIVPRGTRNAVINGITAEKAKDFSYSIVTEDFVGNESLPVTNFDHDPPAAVTGVNAVYSRTNSSITLSWIEPSDDDFYQVKITYNYNGGAESEPVFVRKGTTSLVIPDIEAGKAKDYTYSITSRDSVGNESETVTYFDNTPPAPVSNVNGVYTRSERKLLLSWAEPADADFDHIEISYTYNNGAYDSAESETFIVEKGTTSKLFENIKGYAKYYSFTIISVDTVGNSCSYNYNCTVSRAPEGFVEIRGATVNDLIYNGNNTENHSRIFDGDHTYVIPDMYVCDHELTQKEFEQYCTYAWTTQSKFPTAEKGLGDNYPVYYVCWYDAVIYCNLRSLAEGLSPCYSLNGEVDPRNWEGIGSRTVNEQIKYFALKESGNEYIPSSWRCTKTENGWIPNILVDVTANGYRMPMEYEWEYVALEGDDGIPEDYIHYLKTADETGVFTWNKENSNNMTHEVKQKTPNRLGIFDMLGNVWELTNNNDGTVAGGTYGYDFRMYVRGGYYNSPWHSVNQAWEYNTKETYLQKERSPSLGFRVFRTITDSE